jgi:uncharacterized protein YcnI
MRMHPTRISYLVLALLIGFAISGFGHVRVSPRESAAGATQRYTMSVPTERQSPTVRIEIAFPASLTVMSFGETAGWKVEPQKDSAGRISRAVWSGGSIAFADRADFYFDAKNPASQTRLEWKVIQIYEDGIRSEWTGPEGSRSPASVTTVK